jgi:hypothetical protein
VIVFSGLAGSDNQRLVAACPLLMLAQMLALPDLLWLFVGPELADIVEVGPFLEAFGILIVLPLALTRGHRGSHGTPPRGPGDLPRDDGGDGSPDGRHLVRCLWLAAKSPSSRGRSSLLSRSTPRSC